MSEEAPKSWDLQSHGMELLKQLDDLAMQAESNVWTSGALFSAAQGVLLLAFFNLVGLVMANSFARPYYLYWGAVLAFAGVIASLSWGGISVLLLARRNLWIRKSKDLQSSLGIPNGFAPWTGEFSFGRFHEIFVIIAWLSLTVIWVLLLNSVSLG